MDMFVHLLALHFWLVRRTWCCHHSQRTWERLGSERSCRVGPVLKDTQATEIRGHCVRCTQALSGGDPLVFLERAERHLYIVQTRTFTGLGHWLHSIQNICGRALHLSTEQETGSSELSATGRQEAPVIRWNINTLAIHILFSALYIFSLELRGDNAPTQNEKDNGSSLYPPPSP